MSPHFEKLPMPIQDAINDFESASWEYAESDGKHVGRALFAACQRTREALAALLLPYVEPAAGDLGQVPTGPTSIEAGGKEP